MSMDSSQNDMDLSFTQLRDELEVLLHQIGHLIRSQHELQEYVKSDSDAVFIEAISENRSAIKNKLSRTEVIRTELLERDINYKGEDDEAVIRQYYALEEAMNASVVDFPSITIANDLNESIVTASAADPGEGIYL